MKTVILSLSLLTLGLSVSACNTVEGFGQDVERAGEKIQETF